VLHRISNFLSEWFRHQWALQVTSDCDFGKGEPDFVLLLQCNYISMNGLHQSWTFPALREMTPVALQVGLFLITDFERATTFFNWCLLHCNYTSIVHCFRYNELLLLAGNNAIAISSLGALQVGPISDCRFWKGDPDFIFILSWHFLPISNGTDVIFVSFWQNNLKHLLDGYYLAPDYVFWAIVREKFSIRLAFSAAQERSKKKGRKVRRSVSGSDP